MARKQEVKIMEEKELAALESKFQSDFVSVPVNEICTCQYGKGVVSAVRDVTRNDSFVSCVYTIELEFGKGYVPVQRALPTEGGAGHTSPVECGLAMENVARQVETERDLIENRDSQVVQLKERMDSLSTATEESVGTGGGGGGVAVSHEDVAVAKQDGDVATAKLPFNPTKAVTHSVVQLELIGTMGRIVKAHFHAFCAEDFEVILSMLLYSAKFAQTFNNAVDLRTRLWERGFMKVVGRPEQRPNLLRQATSAMSECMLILLRLYCQYDPNQSMSGKDKVKITYPSARICCFLSLSTQPLAVELRRRCLLPPLSLPEVKLHS